MTDRTYSNMLNQKPATRKPASTPVKGTNIWGKMMKKGKSC